MVAAGLSVGFFSTIRRALYSPIPKIRPVGVVVVPRTFNADGVGSIPARVTIGRTWWRGRSAHRTGTVVQS